MDGTKTASSAKPKISNVDLFTYHKPDDAQIEALDLVRGNAINLADAIEKVCPPSADRTTAIRKLRECVHVAAAAIMLRGAV